LIGFGVQLISGITMPCLDSITVVSTSGLLQTTGRVMAAAGSPMMAAALCFRHLLLVTCT
jgi:hypothetical protein